MLCNRVGQAINSFPVSNQCNLLFVTGGGGFMGSGEPPPVTV